MTTATETGASMPGVAPATRSGRLVVEAHALWERMNYQERTAFLAMINREPLETPFLAVELASRR